MFNIIIVEKVCGRSNYVITDNTLIMCRVTNTVTDTVVR